MSARGCRAQGHDDLIVLFNQFLPEGHDMRIVLENTSAGAVGPWLPYCAPGPPVRPALAPAHVPVNATHPLESRAQ